MRRIRPGEGRRLRDIRLRALLDAPYAFSATLADVEHHPEDVWDRRAREGSQGPDQATFVAEHDGEFVAMAVGMAVGGETAVYSVWTDPDWRRMGVGSEVMERLTDWAVEAGSRALRLWVADSNPTAESWYRARGFKATGDSRVMLSNPDERELEYVLPLDQPSRSRTV